MLDFDEGWDLYQRLCKDGYLTLNNEIGKELESKICGLAQKYYNWTPKEPSNSNVSEGYREALEMQTDLDRLSHIWEIAVDYDGYRTYRGLAHLLDEVIACCQVKTMDISNVLHDVMIFNQYETIDDFMNCHFNFKEKSFIYSFPVEKWRDIENWCEDNGFKTVFLTLNRDKEGESFAVALKIERKD